LRKQDFEERKKDPLQFNRSTCKKILSLIDPAITEKKGGNFIGFDVKLIFRKPLKKVKF
jgi:hypothetical protein